MDVETRRGETNDHERQTTMCPVCLTTVLLIAAGVASTGGLAAAALKKSGVKNPKQGDTRHDDAQDRNA